MFNRIYCKKQLKQGFALFVAKIPDSPTSEQILKLLSKLDNVNGLFKILIKAKEYKLFGFLDLLFSFLFRFAF